MAFQDLGVSEFTIASGDRDELENEVQIMGEQRQLEQGVQNSCGDKATYGELQAPDSAKGTSFQTLPRLQSASNYTQSINAFTTHQEHTDSNSYRDFIGIIQPINAKKARRTFDFNISTLPRDILYTTYELNTHLDILKAQYKEVNDFSDLSTFRWDLVDPLDSTEILLAEQALSGRQKRPSGFGSGSVKRPCPKPTSPFKHRSVSHGSDDIEDPMLKQQNSPLNELSRGFTVVMPPQISESTTIMRDPTRPPNYGPFLMRKSAPGGTIQRKPKTFSDPPSQNHGIQTAPNPQQNHSHPGYIPSQPLMQPMGSQQFSHSHPVYQSDYSGLSSTGHGHHGQSTWYNNNNPSHGGLSSNAFKPHASVPLGSTYKPVAATPGFQIVLHSPAKAHEPSRPFQFGGGGVGSFPVSERSSVAGAARRGRPPGSSRGDTPSKKHSTSPKKRGRPFRILGESSPANPEVPKKRGRPFKSAEVEARAPRISSSLEPGARKRGRPAKNNHELVFLPPPVPIFHPFLCEWEDCPAELHNLETLQNHIIKVHTKKLEANKVLCLWAKCRKLLEDDAQKSNEVNTSRLRFETKQELRDHLIKAHLIPFSWHMGEGPKATSLGMFSRSRNRKHLSNSISTDVTKRTDPSVSSPWLYDSAGNMVTPSLEGQHIEQGKPAENNAKKFTKVREGLDILLVPIDHKKADDYATKGIEVRI